MRSHLWVSKGSGPLAGYAEGYGQWVEARGYSPRVVSQKVWQLSQLSCWLEREGLAVEEWTAEMTARFAAGLQAAGYRSYLWRLSLRVPLAYLRELGVMPAPSLAAGPVEELLANLRTYLARERGLFAGTIRNYERAGRVFLEDRVERVGGLELPRLAAGDVTRVLGAGVPATVGVRRDGSGREPAGAAAVSACRGVDRRAVGVGGAEGRGSEGPVAAEGGGARRGHRDAGGL